MNANPNAPGGFAAPIVRPPEPCYDDGVEYADTRCPKCGGATYRRECGCEDGYSHHDCGEDCCCCLDPEPNVICDDCEGHGWCNWCPTCGWDLLCNRYINGRDERGPNMSAHRPAAKGNANE